MQMIRVGLLVVFSNVASFAFTAVTVGDLGDPDCLKITGNSSFTTKAIKDALSSDAKYVEAGDREAMLDEFVKTIERLVVSGYKKTGFADVQVKVEANDAVKTIAVGIDEGRRYLSGEIIITNAKTIPVKKLISRLTEKHPPKDSLADYFSRHNGKTIVHWMDCDGNSVDLDDPVWQPGEPADFSALLGEDSEYHREIRHALADLGYFFTKFNVDLEANRKTGKAHFCINVTDESIQSLFRTVTITGNEANSRDDIMKYLSLKPGKPATSETLVELQEKLWHSGRFIKSKVALLQPATPDDDAGIWIHLVELKSATPLNKPFTREEDLFMKCRDHLANPDCWGKDLIIRSTDDYIDYSMSISKSDGICLNYICLETAEQKPLEYALAVSSEEVVAYLFHNSAKYSFAPQGKQLSGSFRLRLANDVSDQSEKRSSLAFAVWIGPDTADHGSPVVLHLVMDPVYFIDLSHRKNATYDFKDGVFIMKDEDETYRLDAASGKLIEFLLEDHSEEDALDDSKPAGDGNTPVVSKNKSRSKTRFYFHSNECLRRINENHARSSAIPNACDSRRLLSSCLSMICTEWHCRRKPHASDGDNHVYFVIKKLLDNDVCEPFDKIALALFSKNLVSENDENSNIFTIPTSDADNISTGNDSVAAVARGIFLFTRRSFPVDSWPERLGKSALYLSNGQQFRFMSEMQKIRESEDSGPLCYLTISTALKTVGISPLAEVTAAGGLEKLDLDDFRKEYRVLLDQKYPMGQFLIRLGDQLRRLDDSDVQSLCVSIPDKYATITRRWVQQQRQFPDRPVEIALSALLDELWQGGLQEDIRELLKRLAHSENPLFASQAVAPTTDRPIFSSLGVLVRSQTFPTCSIRPPSVRFLLPARKSIVRFRSDGSRRGGRVR